MELTRDLRNFFDGELSNLSSNFASSIMALLEDAYCRGFDNGYEQGKADGVDIGYNDGFSACEAIG
jgi:hypothetical protein